MEKIQADIQWTSGGMPYSARFDDKYFCQQDGLREAKHVFCAGNDLANRWKNRSASHGTFTIVETGFGTGLNFLCAWKLWDSRAVKNAKLHYVSIERYPLNKKDFAKALSLWPPLEGYARQLDACYRPADSGVQEIHFDHKRVMLTLVFKDVLPAMDWIKEREIVVDAFFLDGFAPSKNPQMWSLDVFKKMAALSRAGTTLATFSSAGSVRRGLNESGFQILKSKGFGAKRHMLKGIYKK